MSEKTKFHNMTKPMKFRRLKLFYNLLVLWCGILRERIIYLFNYVLYKLHIYKRYSYRDNSVRIVPISDDIWCERGAYSHTIRGLVKMNLYEKKNIDLDYFYRIKRNGSKKVTLWLKSTDYVEYFTKAHLEDINLKVADTWYNVSQLPMLKVALRPQLQPIIFLNEFPLDTQPLEYKTVEYNLLPVRSLVYQEYLGKYDYPTNISEVILDKCYNNSVLAFYDRLNQMTLNDLMR